MSELDIAIAIARAKRARDQKLNSEMSYGPGHPRMEEADARQALRDFLGAGVTRGASLGLVDEADAAIYGARNAMTGGRFKGAYDARLDENRRLLAEAEQRNPSAVQAGAMTGSALLGAVPVGGALSATRNLGVGAQSLATGTTAAGMTALQLFNEGEGGAEARVENVAGNLPAVGTAFGTGAAVPVAGRLVGGAARGVTQTAQGGANRAVRGLGMDPVAAREVSRAFRRDANFLTDADAYLRGIGPEATISDLGTNTRQTARGLAGMPGEAGQDVALTATQRQRGRVNRVRDDMDSALGIREDADLMNESLRGQRRQAAKQAYDAFYQRQIPVDGAIRDVLRRADKAGAMADARKIAAAEGFDIDLSDNLVAIDGRGLDVISRALRDASNRAWREGNGELGQALGDLNEALLQRAPALRAVRRRYARDSDLIAANEEGASILDSKEPNKTFERRWNRMSREEQAEFRLAARDALSNKIDSAVRDDTASLNVFGPTNTMAKIRTVFGPRAARAIERRVAAERVMAGTDNRIRGGSDTAATEEFQRGIAPYAPGGQRPSVPARAWNTVNDLGNAVVDSVIRRNPEAVTRDIARALTAQGPERNALVQALIADAMAAQANSLRFRGMEGAVTNALAAAPGAAAYLAR